MNKYSSWFQSLRVFLRTSTLIFLCIFFVTSNSFAQSLGMWNTGDDLIFGQSVTPTEFMRLTSTGRLGIGTTTPSVILALGGDAARSIGMERHTTAAGLNLTLLAGGALAGGVNLNGGNLLLRSGISTGTGQSRIEFGVYNGVAAPTTDNALTTAMVILGDGNVGIGTPGPSSILHVSGTADPLEIRLENTGGNFKTGYAVKTALNEWFIGQESTSAT